MHRTTIIGNLGADPETKYMPSGTPVTNFSVACNEKWKDKDSGEMREHTEWYRCAAFGRRAEIIGEYCRKGSQVYVEGRNRTRSYEKDGEKRYATELVVDQIQLLGGKGSGSGGQGQRQAPPPSAPPPDAGAAGGDDFDDDIPF